MNLQQLVPQAYVDHLRRVPLETLPPAPYNPNIYPEIFNDDQTTDSARTKRRRPCVVISAGDFEEYIPFTGNYRGTVLISVHTHAEDESQRDHAARCNEVFGRLMEDSLADELSLLPGLTVFMVRPSGVPTTQRDGNVWVSSWRHEIDCCPSDL